MEKIEVKGLSINITGIEDNDYISLTDLARIKNSKEPKDVVKNWMRTRSTLEFLGLWEKMNNPEFRGVDFEPLLSETGKNSFTMSPTRWISEFNAIGIKTKSTKAVEHLLIGILHLNLLLGYLLKSSCILSKNFKD